MFNPSPTAILVAVVSLGLSLAAGAGGYRLGRAQADREAAQAIAGERDAWRQVAQDSLTSERQWLQKAVEVQSRWDGTLVELRDLAAQKPKTIREVIREGQTCPDVSVDPATFRVLDAAVTAANAGGDAARARRTDAPPVH